MNDLENELKSKKIINLKGYKDKNGNHNPIYIDTDRLIYNPQIIRNIVNIVWGRLKNLNFDKIMVFDKVSFIIGLGLSLSYNIKIEKYYNNKKDYKGIYIFLIGTNSNYKKLENVEKKKTLILFNCSKNINKIDDKQEIIFFPKKKIEKNCLVLNFKKFSDIVKAIEFYGEKLEIVKIYSSNVVDFNRGKLCKLSSKYQFLIWEGALLSNDLNVFFYQITSKSDFHKWVHFIEIEEPKSNFQNYYKILDALGSKTRINITNDIDIKYYFKNDYYKNNKFLDIFNEK